jgi:hypothetical protein
LPNTAFLTPTSTWRDGSFTVMRPNRQTVTLTAG